MATKTVINTGIQKGYLENSLTQDISSLEAIYDLIDNSIDAARRDIFRSKIAILDEYGMPSDYTGFQIDITVNEKEIKIKDNCSGFSAKDLETRAFFIGSPSSHDYGIGQYGIGLKRALLKMGDEYTFLTDNGTERISAHLTNNDLTSENTITPKIEPSEGDTKSYFAITKLKDAILPDITAEIWYENAYRGIQQRYTIYLEKGLVINIKYQDNSKVSVKHKFVAIREDEGFKPLKFGYYVEDGVYIDIVAGVHADYRFSDEKSYSLASNRALTDDFGIYIVCNDRVIVSSSTEKQYGWATRWHSEYNGFVCIVRFISSDPTLLPINTAKTAVTTDAHLFLKVAEKIQPIADDYRRKVSPKRRKNNPHITFGDQLDFLDENEPFNHPGINTRKPNTKSAIIQKTATSRKTSSQKPQVVAKPKVANKKIKTLPKNSKLVNAINKLNNRKLSQFYESMCNLSVDKYPSILAVTLSVFYESLSRILGNNNPNADIGGYFNHNTIKARVTGIYSSEQIKEFQLSIKYIQEEANLIKHNKNYRMETAINLVPRVELLENITIDMIETHIQNTSVTSS